MGETPTGTQAQAPRGVLALFATTLFISATLLFCVEPMVARMLLPRLGGAPAVWITCMLFFQAALLVAYAYAHALWAWLGPRRQPVAQIVLVALPLFVLPLHFPAGDLPAEVHPAFTLLVLLVKSVGIPFAVLSTTAPLLQSWFSRVRHEAAADPYFLYAASNLGSLVGLAAYPALLEPLLGLNKQVRVWTVGYALAAALVVGCALVTLRASVGPTGEAATSKGATAPGASAVAPITVGRMSRWVGLAFVPSSLLLGVTTFVTTDVAPIPLFWVLPLALYLLSFILVFARRPPLSHRKMVRILPVAVTFTATTIALGVAAPASLLIFLHLATLFFGSMVCHGELAADRPDPANLTRFYLLVSLGGVLGGLFNALVAPAVFHRVVEYPLAIVLACMCRRVAVTETPRARALDLALPAIVGVAAALVFRVDRALWSDPTSFLSRFVVAAPFFVAHGFLARPLRYALTIGAALAASAVLPGVYGETVLASRNFYGIVRVTHDAGGRFAQLVHGNTFHGRQFLDPARRGEPLDYYRRKGPLGAIFAAASHPRVGVIGLGAGTMAAYAAPGEAWTFYEINPAVTRVARDPRYFTYLSDHFPDGKGLTVVEGDARLRLREAPDGAFDLLALDAFSSDAIPAHLLTREAVALYLAKLAPHGILAAHISNRYLDLRSVFAGLACDAALVAYDWYDESPGANEIAAGGTGSHWVALARTREDLGPLATDPHWTPLPATSARVWTDDFSNVLGVYRW